MVKSGSTSRIGNDSREVMLERILRSIDCYRNWLFGNGRKELVFVVFGDFGVALNFDITSSCDKA